MDEELLSVQQVAIELKRSEKRVREYCREGRLGQKIGRQWIITRPELEAFKLIPRKHGAPFKEDEED